MFHVKVRRMRRRTIVLALCVVALAGCGKDDPAPLVPMAVGTLAPDFSLSDVNPASGTYNQPVSPRSQLGKVSAWYFGHAT
jgi:predicted small lipoprotein YifL